MTLLFTDFVSSTELFDRLGDDAANDVRRTHFRLLRDALASYAGDEIKTLGDGLMVAFQSSVTALGCAAAMQEACERHRQEREGRGLGLRIGVNAGEVIRDEDDYFGTAVVVAKRLCDHAQGGQVLVSELVRGLVGSRGGHAFRDLGPLTLKGLADPVRGYELVWESSRGVRRGGKQEAGPARAVGRAVPASTPAAIRIQLCAPLTVEIAGRRVEEELPGRQGRLLFAFLAANRQHAVSRDSLIDVLWPEQPARDPDAALSVLLSKLRRLVGAKLLPARGQLQLRLPEDAWIDIEVAEEAVTKATEALGQGEWKAACAAAREALGLLKGEFVPGLESEWAVKRRHTLDSLRRDALECLTEAALALGGTGRQEAERSARQLTEHWPYHESGYRLLMEALAAQGNTAEALLVFDRLRTLLRDELGATPGASLKKLHERLLTGERPEPAASEGALAAAAGEWAMPGSLAGDELFVGRGEELGHLRKLWQQACAGKPQLALVAGEPGVGKTRLATELARSLLGEGGRVLYGRCDEEPLVPYQPFVEALGHYVTHSSVAELRERLSEEGAELAPLVPELARRLPDLPKLESADPAAQRYRLLEALSHGLAAISEVAPLLLVLDDLHWADKPTLVMLRHVVRRAERARLLILATYRETELGEPHPLSSVLADVSRERRIDPLVLEGLTKPDVEALVAARGGEEAVEELAHTLHEETAGNPLFVEETLRHLLTAGKMPGYQGSLAAAFERRGIPKTVEEVIGRRLSNLREETRTVLSAASIIGREFDLNLLRHVCELPSPSILEALEEAAAARLISEVAGTAARYRFSHALVRETLRARLPAGRRVELHLRVGEALERTHAGRANPHVADLAYHFLEAAVAGDVDKAVGYAARAADEAIEKLAYEEAARQLERALTALELKDVPDELERCELLLRLGEAWWSAGAFESSRDSFRAAAELAGALGAPAQLARGALGFGGQYVAFQVGVVDELLIGLLERALEAMGEGDSALRARVMARLAEALTYSAEQGRKASLAREAAAVARRSGDRAALGDVLNRIEWATRGPDDLEERLALTQEIVRLGDELGDAMLAAAAHDARISHLLEAGDAEASAREFEAFEARASALRQPYLTWLVSAHRAGRGLLEGRLGDVEELALRALEAGQEAQNTNAAQLFGAQILHLRAEQGRLAELVDAVESFVEQYPALPVWRCVLAWVYTELGRDEEAHRELERLAQNDFTDLPRDAFWLLAGSFLSEVVSALGDRRRAVLLYESLLPYADRCAVLPPASVCHGSLSRSLGVLATNLSRFDEGARHFERAIDVHIRLRAHPWHARTLHDYGRLLVARGQPGDLDRARELLAEACATARGLGMTRLLQRASDCVTAV